MELKQRVIARSEATWKIQCVCAKVLQILYSRSILRIVNISKMDLRSPSIVSTCSWFLIKFGWHFNYIWLRPLSFHFDFTSHLTHCRMSIFRLLPRESCDYYCNMGKHNKTKTNKLSMMSHCTRKLEMPRHFHLLNGRNNSLSALSIPTYSCWVHHECNMLTMLYLSGPFLWVIFAVSKLEKWGNVSHWTNNMLPCMYYKTSVSSFSVTQPIPYACISEKVFVSPCGRDSDPVQTCTNLH